MKRAAMTPTSAPVTVTIDNREHELIRLLRNIGMPHEVAALEVGDIQYSNGATTIVLERKSLADLKASIRDGRYREQKGRMQAATSCAGYIIEGDFRITEEHQKSGVVGAVLNTLLRDRMIVLFSNSTRETALYVQEIWKRVETDPDNYFPAADILRYEGAGGETCEADETAETAEAGGAGAACPCAGGLGRAGPQWVHSVKTKVRRIDNMDPPTSTLLMLSQIPGVSSRLAQSIYEACCTKLGRESVCMAQLIEALNGDQGLKLLKSVPLIGAKKANTICEYLFGVGKN